MARFADAIDLSTSLSTSPITVTALTIPPFQAPEQWVGREAELKQEIPVVSCRRSGRLLGQ